MGHIRAYYESITHLQEWEWQFIAAHFGRKVFKKGEFITQQGKTENYLSFIETGTVRFFIPGDDKELTFHFCFDKEFTCAYDSFLTRTPSAYALQALTETIAWQISFDDLQRFMLKHMPAITWAAWLQRNYCWQKAGGSCRC